MRCNRGEGSPFWGIDRGVVFFNALIGTMKFLRFLSEHGGDSERGGRGGDGGGDVGNGGGSVFSGAAAGAGADDACDINSGTGAGSAGAVSGAGNGAPSLQC